MSQYSFIHFFYHHLWNTCSVPSTEPGTEISKSPVQSLPVPMEDLSLKCHLQTLLQSGKKKVFPSWFSSQCFGLFVRKNSPWTFWQTSSTRFKTKLLVPPQPLLYWVGLKSVVSFFVLDDKVNSCSAKKPNHVEVCKTERKVFCVLLSFGRSQSPERTS